MLKKTLVFAEVRNSKLKSTVFEILTKLRLTFPCHETMPTQTQSPDSLNTFIGNNSGARWVVLAFSIQQIQHTLALYEFNPIVYILVQRNVQIYVVIPSLNYNQHKLNANLYFKAYDFNTLNSQVYVLKIISTS